jgi:hypothetical protein
MTRSPGVTAAREQRATVTDDGGFSARALPGEVRSCVRSNEREQTPEAQKTGRGGMGIALAPARGSAEPHEIMLADFVISNRNAIIDGARARVALRTCPKPSDDELANGIPVFLDQLTLALRQAESSNVIAHGQLAQTASRHGLDLFRMGLTIAQVVHDYGDVCQTITELAVEQKRRSPLASFRRSTSASTTRLPKR